MGLDPSSSLPSGSKRTRPDDELYLDNFHAHKRYLTEVMACSLNGLRVGDSLPGGSKAAPQNFEPMDSPAVTENGGVSKSISSYPSNGDELSTLDSYMSDDSDDSICYRMGRYCESPQRVLSSLCESSRTVSPLRSFKGAAYAGYNNSAGGASASGVFMSSVPLPCTQPKQRVPDTESRFPPSPSDPCHAADLRRAALLRSLQMRAQSPVAVCDAAAVDECSDACEHSLAEAEDQCSPCSPSFDELSAEQTACNHDILGSPVHGTFPGQTGRGSGRVRSLLLDDCANVVPEAINNVEVTCFEGAVPSVITGISLLTPDTDNLLHSQSSNAGCGFPGMYAEEVSDSTDKSDTVSRNKWSNIRSEQLCSYFYKGSTRHKATSEDQ